MGKNSESRVEERSKINRPSMEPRKTAVSREFCPDLATHFGNSALIALRTKPALNKHVFISKRKESRSRKFGCSIPKSKGQKQPKSVSLGSIEKRRKIPPSGPSTLKSRIGTSAYQRDKSGLTNKGPLSWSNSTLTFCLSLISNCSQFVIGSHIFHNFKKCYSTWPTTWWCQYCVVA